MNPPGWYPDPSGIPNSYRWWDGQIWTAATTSTPATAPAPQNAAPQAGPETPGGTAAKRKRNKLIVGVGIGAVALILIVAGAVVLPRVLGGGDDPAPPPVPTSESAGPQSPGADPSGPAKLNCAGGNQQSTGSQAPIYSGGGLQYKAPKDWGFRFGMSQWTWLDDQSVWGKTDVEPVDEEWGAGVALGGVQKANGFNDPATAATNIVTCLTRYGFLNDGSWKTTEESSEDVTVAGLKGHRSVYLLSDGTKATYPGYQVVALVLDTGRKGSFGTWMSFGPKGESTSGAQIEAAEKSITGN